MPCTARPPWRDLSCSVASGPLARSAHPNTSPLGGVGFQPAQRPRAFGAAAPRRPRCPSHHGLGPTGAVPVVSPIAFRSPACRSFFGDDWLRHARCGESATATAAGTGSGTAAASSVGLRHGLRFRPRTRLPVTDQAVAKHRWLPPTSPSPQTPIRAPHDQPVRPDTKPYENRTMARRVFVYISRSEWRVVDPDGVYCLVATSVETRGHSSSRRRFRTMLDELDAGTDRTDLQRRTIAELRTWKTCLTPSRIPSGATLLGKLGIGDRNRRISCREHHAPGETRLWLALLCNVGRPDLRRSFLQRRSRFPPSTVVDLPGVPDGILRDQNLT
jgi:hypothetical protein